MSGALNADKYYQATRDAVRDMQNVLELCARQVEQKKNTNSLGDVLNAIEKRQRDIMVELSLISKLARLPLDVPETSDSK